MPITAAHNLPSESPDVAEAFCRALKHANHQTQPFDYWLLKDVLPRGQAEAIANLPFAPPQGLDFNGRRETNNATRVYFSPENQARFDVCRKVVEGFKSSNVINAIERTTGADLSDVQLRIEYCQDTKGFWLEPHTDISVKKFTMLIYLVDDPALADAGTQIHEGPPDFAHVASAPYGLNKGVIFIPAENTWHAVGKQSVSNVRKSIIINYVDKSWRDDWELA